MPDDVETVRVHYSESLVRTAVRTFIWRRLIIREKLLWATAVGLLLLCVARLGSGDRSWITIFFGVAALLPTLLVSVGWLAHLRAKIRRLRSLQDSTAEFDFHAEGFGARSAAGELTLPWSSVREAWAGRDFWLLLIASNEFVTLPTRDVPPSTLDNVRNWLGPKVIDL